MIARGVALELYLRVSVTVRVAEAPVARPYVAELTVVPKLVICT